MIGVVLLLWITSFSAVHSQWYAHDYWNARLTGRDGYTPYDAVDTSHGLWSDNLEALEDNYLLEDALYDGGPRCTGCDCTTVNLTCTGPVIDLKDEDFMKLEPSTFSNPTAITSIQIIQAPTFEIIHDENTTDVFEEMINLESLIIQRAEIKDFPNINNTKLEILNLVENNITFFTANWTSYTFPATLTHVALGFNKIHWIPERAFSGSSIKILSVSYNLLEQFPSSSFEDMPALMYLGLDGNNIKSVSKRQLMSLQSSPLQHLNLSNNAIYHIERDALTELNNLTVLELHQNKFVTIPVGTFADLPAMLHLEMNNNLLQHVPREAFTDMPKLVSLLLHSQVDPMTSIAYNAFVNISQSLENLWVSNNGLTTFPHQVLSQENYTSLHTIYADHNSISSVVEFGQEAFPLRMTRFWEMVNASYVPYSTVKNLRILYLHANRITEVQDTDFCEMSILTQLYLDSNLLTEDTLADHCFQCLPVLTILGLNSNQMQYVPEAVMFKDHLPSIIDLRLGANHLTFIETNTFTELDTLQTLHLYSNGIISIEDDSFPNESLMTLYLADNEFRFLEKYPFYNLTELVWLDLQRNDITVIPDEAFHELYNLQSLFLNSNNIKRLLKTHFKDSPLSGYLHFEDNEIGYIEDGTFAHVTSCIDMLLNNNFLSELPNGGDFNSLAISLQFSIQNNYITAIRTGTFKDFSAEYMYLSDNKIGHIYPGAFEDVSTSVDLFLTGNPLGQLYAYSFNKTQHRYIYMNGLNISVIPSLAFSQVSAENFYLQESHIQTIEEDAFNGLSVSQQVYLNDNELTELKGSIFGPTSYIGSWLNMQNNYLTELPDDAFADVSLTFLNLDNNLLEIYPGPALSVSTLDYISLDNNQIYLIPPGSFTSASSGLLDLSLEGNNVTVIQADLFSELSNLRGLHMQNNFIMEVQPLAFDGTGALVSIELQNNQIQFLPVMSPMNNLVTLDLSNNRLESIESDAFDDTPMLGTLPLGGNLLGCECELFHTLNKTYQAIKSGNCTTPLPAARADVSLTKSMGLYFLDEDVNQYFLCAGSNLAASAPAEYEILVTFDPPPTDYVLQNDTITVDPNSTVIIDPSRTYYVECTSPVSTTLSTQVEDPLGNGTGFQVLFNHSHGVVPGLDYTCRLSLETNDTVSAKTYPVYVTSLTTLNNTLDAGPNDYILDITYLDFSVTHPDFTTGPHDEYRNISYMRSPYGNWLTDGGAPLTSTMAEWFRPEPATNIEFVGNIVLKYMPTEGTHKYWNNKYFPLDTLGYAHEDQRDCSARLHNFGFTSTVKGGVMFEGNGTVSVGGGDQMWLAVNKTVLVEVYTELAADDVPCKTVDLTPAATPGGGWIVPESGTIDIVTGECDASTTLPDEKVWLELEVGNTYHFEVFHVERELCLSQIFIETRDLAFYQNISVEDPAMDYFVYVQEDFHLNGILAELDLTDHFTTGPPFDLTLLKGNEARHFTLKDNSAANMALGVAPAPEVYNHTVLAGVDIPFVECPSPAVVIPEPVDTSTEPFSISTTLGLLTLETAVDYEVEVRYVLVFELVDNTASPARTGSIVVTINLLDVNDNCPVVSPELVELVPVPSLQVEPLYYITATDADSTNNGELYYSAATPTVDPPLESTYDISMDYYRSVYNESNIVEVKVVVLDRGTDPVRGTITQARLNISNSCLLTVLFTNLELRAEVNQTDAGVMLRIPGYFVDPFECTAYVGMEVGWITDSQIFASSSYDITSLPARARLNITDDTTGDLLGGWVAGTNDLNQYIGVDFLEPYRLTEFLMQGRHDADMWVETYQIEYTTENGSKEVYTDKNGVSVFSGSTDRDTIVRTVLDPVLITQTVEIHPVTWHNTISLRMEFVACSVAEYIFTNTRCQRCKTGSYCLGDGEIYGCTSCDESPANKSCGVNGTDHSYGGFEGCTTCPDGWLCHDGVAEPCPLYHYAPCTADSCEEACLPCPEGHACLGGIITECRPGHAALALSSNCSLCVAGTYQNASGQGTCLNCPVGYESATAMDHCNPCPGGTYSTGDGSICSHCADPSLCACENPVYPCFMKDSNLIVPCMNTAYDGSSFECGECPPGYTGDGITCTDIDECADYDPCFSGRCINQEPGYQCLGCPRGYTGYFRDGLSFSTHNRIFQCNGKVSTSLIEQICEDVDECVDQNGGCDTNAHCLNYQGNYTCGPCVEGYLGSSFYGCHIDNYCVSGNNSCSYNSTCIHTGPGTYRCECDDGYTGTGLECGKDTDLDGHPDKSLSSCLGFGCKRDNCPTVPNSGQEDADGDWTGDNCDYDDDNDVVPDVTDNCKYVYNPWQTDTDGDGIGDDCDNCVNVNNTLQTDTDGNSIGDECDDDIDGDGLLNGADNCPLVTNPGQQNSDGDSHGDACDNCPQTDNEDQQDTDQSGFGDACAPVASVNIDRDGDGIPNDEDNCPFYPNPSQSDIDSDSIGDECDEDTDGDGLLDVEDNCDLVANPGQEDAEENGVGDACGLDSDGDGVVDTEDHCPHNPAIQYTSLSPYTPIFLHPAAVTHDLNTPIFQSQDGGEEIVMTTDVEAPMLILGDSWYGDVQYSGTWYVSDTEGSNYFGFVFGYQNNQKFYVVMMRHDNWNYGNTYRGGIKGLQIKLVTSITGPDSFLADAVWHSADTTDQVTILWQDPDIFPWQHQQPIRWHLIWRPSIGLINVRVVDSEGTEVVSSGDLYDNTIQGGRLGVLLFDQSDVSWSQLIARCLEPQNWALRLDGVDDYVELATISQYDLVESFTIEVWVKVNESSLPGRQPVICTLYNSVCVYLEDDLAHVQVGTAVANGTTVLQPDYWHHITLRYEYETKSINLFINGTSASTDGLNENAPGLDLTSITDTVLYIGRNNDSYFEGVIDEVRIYNRWVPETYLDDYLSSFSPAWALHQKHLRGHYSINSYNQWGAPVLYDTGLNQLHGTVYGDPDYVQDTLNFAVFQTAFPDN